MTQTMDKPRQLAGNGNGENVPALAPARLPYHPAVEERFGVDKASWKALVEAIFPNATSTESVILALSYCRARKLDPFKRNVHIVPIYDKNRRCMVDTIWPGIGELRTTAFRTGEYAGREKAEFGPDINRKIGTLEMTFPAWCQVTVYRIVRGERVSFAGPQVYWLESYATKKHDDDTPNEMWATRTRGQIEKCAEAAALRAAFPEEIGSDHIPEEMGHARQVDSTTVGSPQRGVKGLLSKIQTPVTNRPLSEGMTLDTDPERNATAEEPAPEAIADAEAERILRDASPSAQESAPAPDPVVQPDVGRTNVPPEQEADAGAEAFDWSNAAASEKRCREQARDIGGVDRATFNGGLTKYTVALGHGPTKPKTAAEWEQLYQAISQSRFNFKDGVIAPV